LQSSIAFGCEKPFGAGNGHLYEGASLATMGPQFYVYLDYAGGITLSTVGGRKQHLNAAAVSKKPL
jgi:hypothetical protein